MADSIHYIKKLYESLKSADIFYVYSGRLKTIADVMDDPRQLADFLECGRDQAAPRAREFMAALFGIFPKDRVYEICKMIADTNTGLDGKETLFYLEAALLEVKRYFFRRQKLITKIMRRCEFPYEQYNEELLPLASTVLCSYEPPYMKPAQLFPYGYGDLRLPSPLPVSAEFIETERGTGVLQYISPEIREGLLARGQRDFFSKYSDFFSTLFADSVLFLKMYATIPEDIENRDQLQKELLEYLRELCKSANIEPDAWIDAGLLNTWLTREAYDQLKRSMRQYGVTDNILAEDRPDMPGWETRYHAAKVQFSYWKPFGHGFIRMGANSVSEYQSIAALEAAVVKEIGQSADSARLNLYLGLLRRMRDVEDNSRFEELAMENLLLLADMAYDIRKKKIAEDSYFGLYYSKICGPFLRDRQYRVLLPPVKAGDILSALDGEMPAAAEPPFELSEAPIICRIEKTTVQSFQNTGIKVKAASPGLMRGHEILAYPSAAVEAPVSPQDKLEELAESLDNVMHEIRTEKDILGVRRYINSFIHICRIIEHIGISGAVMDTRQKVEWFNQNHFIYNLFNFTPQEGFDNIGAVLEKYAGALNGRIQINDYRESFYTVWDLCVTRLNAMGIRETPILPLKTSVTKGELLDGWIRKNTENRAADEEHPADVVYGILKKGVEIDGQLIQKPVVNVYA